MKTEWIKVTDRMPEQRIRVWASSGKFDSGNDCFYGGQSSVLGDSTPKWRYSFICDCLPPGREKEGKYPITHWMPLPESPWNKLDEIKRLVNLYNLGYTFDAGGVEFYFRANPDIKIHLSDQVALDDDDDFRDFVRWVEKNFKNVPCGTK